MYEDIASLEAAIDSMRIDVAGLYEENSDLRKRLESAVERLRTAHFQEKTLLNKIERLTAEREKCHEIMESQSHALARMSREIQMFREERDDLINRIGNASIYLADWDGYYNPDTGKGSVEGLAELVELAYECLQGKSWR